MLFRSNVVSNIVPSSSQLTAIYINKAGLETVPSNGTLVGYSGTFDVYYIDDIPSLGRRSSGSAYTVDVPTLWITSNTVNYPNYQDRNDGTQPSFSNSTIHLSSYFYVKNLSATHCNITLNGGSIQLPEVIWPGVSGSFITTINSTISSTSLDADYANKTLLNYPIAGTITATISSIPEIGRAHV